MDFFALFRRKHQAAHVRDQKLESELTPLRAIYFPGAVPLPENRHDYPRVISLEALGYGAFLLNVHLHADVLVRIEQLIAELGLHEQLQTGSFQTHRQSPQDGQEAVSLQQETLGEGTTLQLISNSARLFQALPDLAPPPPWQVFPDVDAGGLGSLQGSLAYWWQSYWWPYWQSLSRQQREDWLAEPSHPQGWREYLKLQDALNDTDREFGA